MDIWVGGWIYEVKCSLQIFPFILCLCEVTYELYDYRNDTIRKDRKKPTREKFL